jgi:hypothetical protein
MNKEEILKDFLNTFKMSFRNASIYGTEHPAFTQSITSLKKKTDSLFRFFVPIQLGFTSRSLFIDERFWEKGQVFEELAKIFHFRKFKSLEISEGITQEELVYFISKLSVSPKELIKKGGPIKMMNKEELPHIAFKELDYYELLKGTGEEIRDIWVILLQEALETKNDEKILNLTESFEKVIKSFSLEEIVESDELIEALSGFFSHLDKIGAEQLRECAKEFMQTIMRKKQSLSDSDGEKLRKITRKFREKDLAATLWEEILTDDKFDALNFQIFSTLTGEEKKDGTAHYIASIFRKSEPLQSNPRTISKIKELLSESSSPLISEVYRNTLVTLLREISFQEELAFQHDLLSLNYRFMLINLIKKEKNKNEVVKLLKKLIDEWEKITEQKDYECLKAIYDVLKERKEELASEAAYNDINTHIVEFIERAILQGELSLYFEYFINAFEKSNLDVNVYLEKIFTDGKATPYILRSFFKFFKEYIFYFDLNLEQNASDSRLMKKIIESLRIMDLLISLVVLKNIYMQVDKRLKIDVLQAMQNLTEYDTKFLLPILKDKDFRLKAEAIVILMKDKSLKDHILRRMLAINSPFGTRNKRLLENIKIMEQKNIKEARPYLIALSKRKHYWNRRVRNQAKGVLEKGNVE